MSFFNKIDQIKHLIREEKTYPIASNHFFLQDNSVLAYERREGNSRQPYIYDGLTAWAYGCGYIRVQEGAYNIFPEVFEGKEPNIAFFANANGELVSLLGIPVLNEKCVKNRYTVFAENAIYYFTELEDMDFAVRMFISSTKELYFSLAVLPHSEKKVEITISSYFNPYMKNDNNNNALWMRYFKTGKVIDADTVTFYVTEGNRKDCDISHEGIRQVAFEGGKILYREQTTKKAQFNGGINCNLNNAQVARDCKIENPVHCTAFDDFAIAGDVTAIEMQGNARFDYRFGCYTREKIDLSAASVDALFNLIDHPIDSCFNFNIKKLENAPFSADVLERFIKKVQYQVNVCALGKDMGGGGNIGVRDIAQQIEQALIWNPQKSRSQILMVLTHMFPDGGAPRTFTLPSKGQLPNMDLSDYIDMGIWVINAVDQYLRFTGDYSILDEVCGYYEVVTEGSNAIRRSQLSDSILQHILRITDRLVRNIAPDTHCVQMRYADWNDAIDSLGNTTDPGKKFGTGVSVMATFQAYENFIMVNNILRKLGGYEEKIAEYEAAMAKIKEGVFKYAIMEENGERRPIHGWGDHRKFLVGSFHDIDGKSRISSTSISFFAASSLYDKEYDKDILSAIDRLDSKYGLRTFDVGFDPDLKGIGRIGKLPLGTAENAAVYIHAGMFAVHSLFKIGYAQEAFKHLLKLLPISYEKVDKTPFIMQNAYCYNPEINVDGSALNDWITGSAAVLMKIVFTDLLGLRPDYNGITVDPLMPDVLKEFETSLVLQGKSILIKYQTTGAASTTLNGVRMESNYIPYEALQSENEILVTK